MKTQYKNEAEFKKDFVELLKSTGSTVFCIESEETVPGFPDVLEIKGGNTCLYEMKITDRHGIFKMQKTQPRFYKMYPTLKIYVVIWDNGMHNYLSIPARMILQKCTEHNSFKLDIKEFLYEAAFSDSDVRKGGENGI